VAVITAGVGLLADVLGITKFLDPNAWQELQNWWNPLDALPPNIVGGKWR
jgi:hypothetical protein